MGFAIPPLNPIVDVEAASRAGWRATDLARAFLDGGARFLQLRAKPLTGAALLDMAAAFTELARSYSAITIINDRADVARLAGASGVHLGQDDLSAPGARRLLTEGAIIGRSTHSADQIDAARREPIDYIAIGPVFATSTKATGYTAVGLAMVARAARTGRPVVAIGGITLANARSVIAAGASSVALIGDLLSTGDPAARTRELMAAVQDAA